MPVNQRIRLHFRFRFRANLHHEHRYHRHRHTPIDITISISISHIPSTNRKTTHSIMTAVLELVIPRIVGD